MTDFSYRGPTPVPPVSSATPVYQSSKSYRMTKRRGACAGTSSLDINTAASPEMSNHTFKAQTAPFSSCTRTLFHSPSPQRPANSRSFPDPRRSSPICRSHDRERASTKTEAAVHARAAAAVRALQPVFPELLPRVPVFAANAPVPPQRATVGQPLAASRLGAD